jgi:NADH-quinone oxidoreductase subunit C
MHLEDIKSRLLTLSKDLVLEEIENIQPHGFKVKPDQLVMTCALLRDDETLFFDMLSSITAVDLGSDIGEMELIYHLYSITKESSLCLKVSVDRTAPEIDSVSPIWKAADWHERETFDLFGIHFTGHPDLRRILLPNDWDGYPLRKDYQEQEKYHGITVVYDRED